MTLASLISDIYESLTFTEVRADAPVEDTPEQAEEAEEEEPEDVFPALVEECEKTKECAPAKHHYDECVERVTAAQEADPASAKEDCVEEFFHLVHCTTQCAAPKLWAQLK